MNRTLLFIRAIFVFVCAAAGWLVAYAANEPYWDSHRWLAAAIGLLIGVLTVLVDVLLKGFSLRGLSAITFGLAVGALVAFLIGASPLLEQGDQQLLFLVRLALFVICSYLGMVIALRGKDEFHLVIPYVRFVPHEVEVPLVVVDTSALIDGRIVKICESHFLASALVIPQFVICSYLGMVIALRGKDEFHLVIPYVRFVPHEVEVPLVVVDTSALIDGRIVKICESHFLASALVIPQFVIDAMQMIADSPDAVRQARGRKGLETLNELRKMPHVDLRVVESEVGKGATAEEKLVFIAQSMKARILTTDYNLAQRAQFHGVAWLNINSLAKSLHQTVQVGEVLQVDIAKSGREAGQGVGFLSDGSMVVVEGGAAMIGRPVMVEVASVVPSAGGKMVFARPVEKK